MASNRFGEHFATTTFGESHGPALGVVVDGCPAGVAFDAELLQHRLRRRRPGGALVSSRQEADEAEVLSGVFQGKTLGTPIAIVMRNTDARSEDYSTVLANPRHGHADDMWREKFGHSDPRGGGRASGRETAARVAAGAVAEMFLRTVMPELSLTAFARRIGPFELDSDDLGSLGTTVAAEDIDYFPARFPSTSKSDAVVELLKTAKVEGRSWGGVVELHLDGVPKGIGSPVFQKLKALLGGAYLSVGATAGVEFGAGFAATAAEGSQFHAKADSADYGGMRGGITTGERIVARIALKPTASVLDVAKQGRHDPCIVPRAIPVFEAMTYLVLADRFLARGSDRV